MGRPVDLDVDAAFDVEVVAADVRGCVAVPGFGDLPLVNETSCATGCEFDGTVPELETMLVGGGQPFSTA